VTDRYEHVALTMQAVGYDLAVLLANDTIDRGFRGDAAVQVFHERSGTLIADMEQQCQESCRRLLLSYRKMDAGAFSKPFRDVATDLAALLILDHQRVPPSTLQESAVAPGASIGGAEARSSAESELAKSLNIVQQSSDYRAHMPAFCTFASALFDIKARDVLGTGPTEPELRRVLLEERIPAEIIDAIMPDRSFETAKASLPNFDEEKRVRHESDECGIWLPSDADNERKPAPKAVQILYAQHGLWERFVPESVRYDLRPPSANTFARNALQQALARRAIHWIGLMNAALPIARANEPGFRSVAARSPRASVAADAVLTDDHTIGAVVAETESCDELVDIGLGAAMRSEAPQHRKDGAAGQSIGDGPTFSDDEPTAGRDGNATASDDSPEVPRGPVPDGDASGGRADTLVNDHAQGKVHRAQVRSTWLDHQLLTHSDWTSDKDIEAAGGPTYNTIRRYRSGAQSTRDLYVRRQLAKACECATSEVPE
jgi:hypothetical protein